MPPLARTLTDRLSRSLSAEAAAALAVVAAAGRIGVAEALEVLDHLADPAAALDAAVLAGVVVETGDRLAAAHPLIGAAAVESLPPGRRAQLYRRLAEAASSPERYAHFAALAAGPGPDAAVAEALDAAAAAAHARAANAAAAQFAAQAVLFTPESDAEALVRRRIRAGELLFLAGDVQRSLEHLEALDTRPARTPDLERALPLLLDMTDFIRGTAAATAIDHSCRRRRPESDPRRRALVLALASDMVYGIRGGGAPPPSRRSAAPRPPARRRRRAAPRAHQPGGGEGLRGRGAGRRAARPGGAPGGRACRPAGCTTPPTCTAGCGRGTPTTWTPRGRRCGGPSPGPGTLGDDWALSTFLYYLAATEELAGDYAAAAAAVAEADAGRRLA